MPGLGRKIHGKISGHCAGGLYAEAIDVGESDPKLEHVGVDLLEGSIHRVEVLRAIGAVSPGIERLDIAIMGPCQRVPAIGPVHELGPTSSEKRFLLQVRMQVRAEGYLVAVLVVHRTTTCAVPIRSLVVLHALGDSVDVIAGSVLEAFSASLVHLHIKHDTDANSVCFPDQFTEQLVRTKATVHLGWIGCAKSMVVALTIVEDRRQDNQSDTQVLEVAQAALDALQVATMAPIVDLLHLPVLEELLLEIWKVGLVVRDVTVRETVHKHTVCDFTVPILGGGHSFVAHLLEVCCRYCKPISRASNLGLDLWRPSWSGIHLRARTLLVPIEVMNCGR
mmetsp:Transcript_159748/g.512591  ORF Transcript_159748/g.512591 Transcript_159748/m.512591 type:complete len:336 (-) Transcript_159748:3367-4374(-)